MEPNVILNEMENLLALLRDECESVGDDAKYYGHLMTTAVTDAEKLLAFIMYAQQVKPE